MRETDHLEDPGIDGRITFNWIFKKWDGEGTDWIDMAQDMDRSQVLVNMGMNIWVP
jgi:hypothetical protein